MKADITRSTFDSRKHYSAVLLQQGRVPMDADSNEQADLTRYRHETAAGDLIGSCGAPLHADGFRLIAAASELTTEEQDRPGNAAPPPLPALQGGADFYITSGRYYVDGILCENERITPFSAQPDFPGASLPLAGGQPQEGTYLAYLDVWSRGITALEDASIREVALGGPDTGTREKTIWQVHVFRLGPATLTPAQANCLTESSEWNTLIAPGTGRIAARAQPGSQSDDPCIVAPGAGFRRLENQLYRIEVHEGGALGTATFKWSRENGSIVARWVGQQGANNENLVLANIGKDANLGFASGQWIELTDETRELRGEPGTLAQIVKVDATTVTIDPATATGTVLLADFPTLPKVRRWDQSSLLTPTDATAFLDLESGIQARFEAGTYRSGDYWLIPARTATGDIEWKRNSANQPEALPPHGITHHHCRLAIMRFDGSQWTSISDCRSVFPPTSELVALLHVGGDGQEGFPGQQLPHPIQVRVANGENPIPGRLVRFAVVAGGGTLSGTQPVATTAPNGLAECRWTLGTTTPSPQRVEAVLLDSSGNPVPGQIVAFNATQNLPDQGPEPVIQIQAVRVKALNAAFTNGMVLAPEEIAEGIEIQCSQAIDPATVRDGSPPEQFDAIRDQPTCFVAAEIPYPLTQGEINDWSSTNGTFVAIGYRPLVLRAQILAQENIISWQPTTDLVRWLKIMLDTLVVNKSGHDRVLARLTLKGNFITQSGNPNVFLDGDVFRSADAPGLQLPSGDRRRGGDFEAWFWLKSLVLSPSLTIQPNALQFGTAIGTIQIASPATLPVAITLQSTNPGAANVPGSIQIAVGQSQVAFDVSVVRGPDRIDLAISANVAGIPLSQPFTRLPTILKLPDVKTTDVKTVEAKVIEAKTTDVLPRSTEEGESATGGKSTGRKAKAKSGRTSKPKGKSFIPPEERPPTGPARQGSEGEEKP